MDPGDRHPVYPEFYARGTSSVFPLRDGDDRPFGELNAPEAARAGVTFDLRECRYPLSRQGKEMNVSALRQITASWDGILGDVARLRAEYVRHFAGNPDVWWLWRFGICGSAIPGFLVARGVPSPRIPGALGGMFKAIQGIYMTAGLIVERGLRPLDEPISAEDFVGLTEHQGVFVGPTGGACAGPPHMVLEFARAVIEGGTAAPGDDLAELVGDFARLFEYGRGIACQVLLWQILDAHCELAIHQLLERTTAATGPAAQYANKFLAARRQQVFTNRNPAQLVAWGERSRARLREESGLVVRDVKAPAALAEELAALAGHAGSQLAADPPIVAAWAEMFASYILLERELLGSFNQLERQIEHATGQPRRPDLGPNQLAEAYYKNLRTLLRAPLGVTITVAGDRVTAAARGRAITI